MSRFLVDTSAYSAFFRGDPEIKVALQACEEICVTPIILGELQAGFRRGGRRALNEKELGDFLAAPRVRVVNLDEETSTRYALILDSLQTAGTPIPTNDIWIAASAMQHGLEVLTTDSHFAKVSQIVTKLLPPAK